MAKEKSTDTGKRLSKPTLRSASGESCFRRSPRLASSPAKIEAIVLKTPVKKRPLLKSDALALTLHVNGDGVNEDEPTLTPLKMYNPNSLRRSPRCTANKYRSAAEHSAESSGLKSEPALSTKCMRRSPRLSAGLVAGSDGRDLKLKKSAAALDSNLIEWEDSLEKGRSMGDADAREVGVKWMRSRSVPMRLDGSALRDSSIEPPSKKVKTSLARSDVRKSPRLCANVDVKCSLLALPEQQPPPPPPPPSSSAKQSSEKTKTNLGKSDSNGLGERCLRSRKIPVLMELPDISTDRKPREKIKSALGSCDSDVSGNKCLRSQTIPFRQVGIEDIESKRVSIELPDISRDKKQLEEIKTDSGSCDVDGIVEKCLRSRKVPFRVVGTENEDTKSALIALPTASRSGDLDGIVEKCLRSRKVPFRVVATENEDTKPDLIALPDVSAGKRSPQKIKACASSMKKEKNQKTTCLFIGEPVPEEEARERWRWRYELKSQRSGHQSKILNAGEEDEIILNVECHYTQAEVESCIFKLGDCAYIKGNGREKHVGRILEFFKTMDGKNYFRVQWFFRAEDTVMKGEAAFHDKKRLFYSTLMNDNLLDCIISKVIVIQVAPMLGLQPNSIPPFDFYYDMEYCVEYSTFRTLPTVSCDLSWSDDIEAFRAMITSTPLEDMPSCEPYKVELALLDLYSGCGGMSTGLCLGAKLSSVNLLARWAVDTDRSACDSLKLNHPETQVRNETAEDFLELLKGWEKLCQWYVFNNLDTTLKARADDTREVKSNLNSPSDVKISAGEYEVLRLVDICYGDSKTGKGGLKFKVRWKGYSSSEDTWEPIEGLSNCQERIQDFVRSGFKSKLLPLPGDVDVLCGGPPCQGISGYNRYRNVDSPLDDERNHQIVVFMDIVKFLRPKYVLMENVVDILRFDKASLARYALNRLVHMKYQARLGTMAAGCYGLSQFRLRVFLWGALPSEKLPQFPLPTHDVVVRYWPPLEFEQNTVAYDEGEPHELEEPIILQDAISDLPAVTSHEIREQMTYKMPPGTEFQKYIRLTKDEMMGFAKKGVIDAKKPILHDHRPYQLSEDDYLRVCQIPHKKGANFRDFPGLVVGHDNMVRHDPSKEKMMLPSGKPMVPDYVFTFGQGKSKRPFARLWWDETVPTVVTFPNLHNQAALHPEQDRVLTIREYARLQGFPDFYRFCGTVKKRYCQVGNAVAVPVARALGYSLGMAIRKLGGNEPLMTLPPKFTFQQCPTD